MLNEDFERILKATLISVDGILELKGDEYGSKHDRLHNFKAIATLSKAIYSIIDYKSDEYDALLLLWLKHFVSILDIINGLKNPVCKEQLQFYNSILGEKTMDNINYQIILKAMLHDNIDNQLNGDF